jgi:hypothetical protein
MQPKESRAVAADETARVAGWGLPLGWALAMLCLTIALEKKGFYTPFSFFWLLVTLACAVATVGMAHRWRGANGETWILRLCAVQSLWQFGSLLSGGFVAKFAQPVPPGLQIGIYLSLLGAAVVVALQYAPSVARRPVALRNLFCVALTLHFVCGALVILATPNLRSDVWVMQQEACRALLNGENPYAITLPDVLPDDVDYGPQIQQNGRLLFGYTYLPAGLLLALPGYLLTGDHRFSQLAALTLAVGLMGLARPSRRSFAIASVFLFTPRMFFVIEQAWTEPFLLLFLAALLFQGQRARRESGSVLLSGALLATKQFAVLVVPLLGLLKPRHAVNQARSLVLSLLVAAAITLPFVLWNPQAFWHGTVRAHWLIPPREASLSVPTWLREQGIGAPGFLPFVLAGVMGFWLLWHWRAAPAMARGALFAGGAATVWILFFAFAKQSFCNYYFLVLGAWCAAIALWPDEV